MSEVEQVTDWLRIFIEPEQVTELRALEVCDHGGRWTHTRAGFFDGDSLGKMAEQALALTPFATGVYFVVNPINPDLLARCCNRTKEIKNDRQLTCDKDIVSRRWLLVDADPVRPNGISSTDAEKAQAWEVIQSAATYLREHGFHRQILADSGNGYHLLCRTNLKPEDVESIRTVLTHLSRLFDTDAVKIDQKVFNAARIVKLYGTLSRKGDSTPTRPHRRSMILEDRS